MKAKNEEKKMPLTFMLLLKNVNLRRRFSFGGISILIIIIFYSCESNKKEFNHLCDLEETQPHSIIKFTLPSQKAIKTINSDKIEFVTQNLSNIYELDSCTVLSKKVYKMVDYSFYKFSFKSQKCGRITVIGIFNEEKFFTFRITRNLYEISDDIRYELKGESVNIYCGYVDNIGSILSTSCFVFNTKKAKMYETIDDGFTNWK